MGQMKELLIALMAVYCIMSASSYRMPAVGKNLKDGPGSGQQLDDSSSKLKILILKRSLGQHAHSDETREIEYTADNGRTTICEIRSKSRDLQNFINVTMRSIVDGFNITPSAEPFMRDQSYVTYNLEESASNATLQTPSQERTPEQKMLVQFYRSLVAQSKYLTHVLENDTRLSTSTNENVTNAYLKLFSVRIMLTNLRSRVTGRIGIPATDNIRPPNSLPAYFEMHGTNLHREGMRAFTVIGDTYRLMSSFLGLTNTAPCLQHLAEQ